MLRIMTVLPVLARLSLCMLQKYVRDYSPGEKPARGFVHGDTKITTRKRWGRLWFLLPDFPLVSSFLLFTIEITTQRRINLELYQNTFISFSFRSILLHVIYKRKKYWRCAINNRDRCRDYLEHLSQMNFYAMKFKTSLTIAIYLKDARYFKHVLISVKDSSNEYSV